MFTAVGGKLELLKLGLDWAIAGDDEPLAMADRPEIATLFARADAAGIITDWTRIQVAIGTRVAGLFEALTVAAGLDPAAKELLHHMQGARREGTAHLAVHLDAVGTLRDGLSLDEVADLLWLTSDPVLYLRLVGRRGWTVERFEAWLIETTLRQILA